MNIAKNQTLQASPQKKNFLHFLNGGLGGFIANLIVQPLQVIKTAFQIKPYSHADTVEKITPSNSIIKIIKFIYKEEGIKGLYRGLVPGCIKSSLSAGTYFYLLNLARKLSDFLLPNNQTSANFMAAALARTLQCFVTNPILIVKTRFEVVGFNEYKNLGDAFIQIYKQEGLLSFFTNGITVALIKDVPFSAIQFPVYELIKKITIMNTPKFQQQNKYSHLLTYAFSSMIATFISCLVTNPLDVIRTRILFQYYNKNTQQHYKGIIDALSKMIKYDGYQGMLFGLQSRFLKKVTGSMIAWTIYESLLDKQKQRK